MRADEPLLQEPSDGGPIPAEPARNPLTSPFHFNLPLSRQDWRLTVQPNFYPLHLSAPKRLGETLDSSSSNEKRTSQDPGEADLDAHLSDFGIPSGRDGRIRFMTDSDVTDAGGESAIEFPTMGFHV